MARGAKQDSLTPELPTLEVDEYLRLQCARTVWEFGSQQDKAELELHCNRMMQYIKGVGQEPREEAEHPNNNTQGEGEG